MTVPFVQSLRTRPGAVVLSAGFGALSFRVEMPERWEVVRVAAQPAESVQAVKIAALEAIMPGADHRDWMMKLHGATIAESETLLEAGAKNGSTFLLTLRRRRPVR
jgi:hypothetical protein